jgi:hypothetical protein
VKKLINEAGDVVRDALVGMDAAPTSCTMPAAGGPTWWGR